MIDELLSELFEVGDDFLLQLVMKGESLGDMIENSIFKMQSKGMSDQAIYDFLVKDFQEEGRTFSTIAGNFRSTVSADLDETTMKASVIEMGGDPDGEDQTPNTWITTSSNPCQDCSPRHGDTRPYSEWVEAGLPKSGFSVCGDNCKCVLVPAILTPDDFGEPVKVKTLAETRKEFQEKLKTDKKLMAEVKDYKSAVKARRIERKNDGIPF